MKQFKFIILTLIPLLFLCIFIICISVSSKPMNEHDEMLENYPQLKDDKHIIDILNGEETLKIISNKESFVLLMGFTPCPWCQALMPYYNKVAKEEGLKKIYYLDILDMRNNPDSPDKIYYDALYTYCHDALDTKNDRISAPTIIVVKEGKLIGYHLGTVDSHVIEGGTLPPLNDNQIKELQQILKDLYKLL